MAIQLDFTGLYYEKTFNLEELGDNPSVESATKFALGKTGNKGGKLIFAEFSDRGFLSSAYVEHRTTPQSRQKDSSGIAFPSSLPTGIYGFNDTLSTNFIEGVQIGFSLAWQYYIIREGVLISGASATSTDRTVVPAANSAASTPLEGNDIIRWRLVAIGGLKELVDIQMADLAVAQRTKLMSNIITQRMTVRESVAAAQAAAQ